MHVIGSRKMKYTDEMLLNIIRKKAKKLGRPPRTTEIKEPSAGIFTQRFGSWEKAIKKAGFNYERKQVTCIKRDEQIDLSKDQPVS